jgi:hypothetical protein
MGWLDVQIQLYSHMQLNQLAILLNIESKLLQWVCRHFSDMETYDQG